MDLDLRGFLKFSINEAKDKESHTYIDASGKKITVSKDKEGNIILTDEDGNKKKGFPSDLSIAKDKEAAQEKAQKDAQKEAERKAKEEIKAQKAEKNADKELDTEKHLEDLGKSIKDNLEKEFGILGVALNLIGAITIGTIYHASKDIKNKVKAKREEQLAILKRTNELMDADKKSLSKMDPEEKADYDKAKSLYDKVMAASYSEDGKELNNKEFAEKLKSQFKDEKEYNEFINDAKNMQKAHPELAEQIDKVIKNAKPAELEKLKKDLPIDAREAEKRNTERKKYESEYNEALEAENKKYEADKLALEGIKKSNDESLSKMQEELDSKNKKLEELIANKPEGMSDEAHKAEIAKMEKDIANSQKTMDKVKEKADAKHKKELENLEKKHTKVISKLKSDFDKKMEKAGIKTANIVQKNAEEEILKSNVRVDDDNDLEDEYKEKTQNPKKVWKQRTYKRGDSTFKTKSYYNKEGSSITQDEFNEKVNTYNKKKVEGEKKNESLSSTLKSTITESFRDYIKNKI